MPIIKLSHLLSPILAVPEEYDKEVSELVLDSRQVKPGSLFFACLGTQTDGVKFIDEAINKGAIAVLREANNNVPAISIYKQKENHIPIFSISHLNEHIGFIASKFFGDPTEQLKVIGITGTTGKTSVCHFIAACLEMAGQPTGIIGTLGNGPYGHLDAPTHTTPNPIMLQCLLAEFVAKGLKNVVMEVSSHGLEQNRVNGIKFHTAIFTNLARDHLDYHENMMNYANAKRKLFLFPHLKYAIINNDDAFGLQLIEEFKDKLAIYTFSTNDQILANKLPQIRVHQVKIEAAGMTATVHTPWGDGVLHTQLIGRFNISNLLAVLTCLCLLDIPLKMALSYVLKLQGVPGRMEFYGGGDNPLIIVDFAHTPEALKQVLQCAREYCQGELWCVFGCGGDRDKGKRPLMGLIAEEAADHIILTDDNPRTENPLAIANEILAGMHKPDAVVVEHDRNRAIRHAMECAHKNDVILIAGRGGEQYQVIGNQKIPSNDSVVVQMILTEL